MQEFEHVEDRWSRTPHHILVNILSKLSWNDRLQARAVCKAWLQAWESPVMWRIVRIKINNRRDANASTVFDKPYVQYARHVEIHWPSAPRKDRLRLRLSDIENRPFVAEAVSTVKTSSRLHTLKLYLDNPCSLDVDFIHLVRQEITHIISKNPKLADVSFGCHQLIMPDHVLDNLQDPSPIHQLHLASLPPRYKSTTQQPRPTTSLTRNKEHIFQGMRNLSYLSLDWSHVTEDLLEALNTRLSPVPMKGLQVFPSHTHSCSEFTHPSLDQWKQFSKDNPDCVMFLVFVFNIDGLCSALQHTTLPIVVKMAEHQQVQLDKFQQIIGWHRSRIEGLVFVNTTSNPVYDPACVMPLAALIKLCTKLRYLTIIGRFIPGEALIWMAQNFHLGQLVVSKSHILTTAEASNFLVPISASKYTEFRRIITRLLGKPWQALASVPFKHMNTNYFSDGLDNDLYLRGCIHHS